MPKILPWSNADIQTVKDMYLAGAAYGTIAKAMGKGRTRRAISGVVHRLKLPKRECAQTQKMAVIRIANKRKREANNAKKPPLRILDADLGHEPFRLPTGDFVTLETVGDNYCRFPIGVPSEADFIFCGNQPQPGSPYCEPCHRRTHVPIKPDATISDRDKAIIAANARKSGLLRALGG